MKRIGVLAVALGLLAVSCTSEGSFVGPRDGQGPRTPIYSGPGVQAVSLERFEACDELIGHLRSEGTKRVTPFGLDGGAMAIPFSAGRTSLDMSAEQAATAPASGDGAASTTTNVQEPGVDEPDMIKNDSSRLFTLVPDPANPGNTSLVATSIEGGRPEVVGKLSISQTYADQMLLAGDRMLVLGTEGYGRPEELAADIAPFPHRSSTVVVVVDVSNLSDMRITDVVRLEGSYISARMIDGVARIVISTNSSRLDFEHPTGDRPADAQAALERNRRVVEGSGVDDWLPQFEITDAGGTTKDDGPVVSCDSTFRPPDFSGFGMVSVVTLDPAAPDPRHSTTVLGDAGITYASARSLYVATQRFGEVMPMGVVEDGPARLPLPASDPQTTSIHRFDISGETASYVASGEVVGTVLNQWSMSEHEGFLRVATTDQPFSPEGFADSSSAVTILSTEAPVLAEVGKVDGLGKGERIYGVRFMGDMGYVVTFRQIDPLHVIDLSTPTRPVMLGELKIPGYSTYLHPTSPGRLLGVGQDATEEGGTLGTQLSLFDVSNPREPRRISQVRLDGANSPVEWDHHAFTWWEPSSLAVVPVEIYQGVFFDRPEPAVGARDLPLVEQGPSSFAVAFRVTAQTVEEIGRVTHHGRRQPAGLGGPEGHEWYPPIQRSLIAGGTLYTVSHGGVLASDLNSLADRGWASF